MFHPALARDFRRNVMAAVAAGFLSVAAWLMRRRARRLTATLSSTVLAGSLALLIEKEVLGSDIAGANVNASGAGVLLSLAESLAAEPPAHTEIWFVGTGCKESDRIGMSAFLDRHQRELEDAWFLGVESVGGAETSLRWITESSILEALRADTHLIQIAEEISASIPDLEASSGMWRASGLDTDVPLVRGMKAMSLMGLTENGRVPNWHSPSDTYENLDEDAIDRAHRFALAVVKRFDSYS